MFQFEKEILSESNKFASVTVLAKGISNVAIINKLIDFYSVEYAMCFILNATSKEIKYFCKNDIINDISNLPIPKRVEIYKRGGVFFGSSRAFITDFVNKNVDILKISTIIVLNAEEIFDDCTESFILYIFKQFNSLGLIKSFITNPLKLSSQSISSICRNLSSSNVQFYPRFHNLIKSEFSQLNSNVIYLKLSSAAEEISIIILELMKGILNDFNKEYSKDVLKLFFNEKGPQEIEDFKTLISLLFSSDALTIYNFYKSMIQKQKELGDQGTWIFSDNSHVLMDLFRQNLKNEFFKSKNIKNFNLNDKNIEIDDKNIEIDNNIKNEFLEESFDSEDLELSFEESLNNDFSEESSSNVEELNYIDINLKSNHLRKIYLNSTKIAKLISLIEKEENTIVLVQNRCVRKILKEVLKSSGIFITVETHYQYKLNFEKYNQIILMNPNLGAIRSVEYNCSLWDFLPKISILIYKNSFEEQIYLSEIREEKDIFERLIEERSRMPLKLELETIDIESDSDEDKEFEIIVDSREMRAKLPFFLYKAQNNILIKTISIGDYILNENICIERKAIDDFKQSLASGRLYQQAKRMVYEYPISILLLEFEGGIPSLSFYDKKTIFKNTLVAKICIFLSIFPQIKIIWSNNQTFSTKAIRDIQKSNQILDKRISSIGIDSTLHEILLGIPGVNSNLIKKIIVEFENIKDLAFSSLNRLEKIMDPERAKKIYFFFREKLY